MKKDPKLSAYKRRQRAKSEIVKKAAKKAGVKTVQIKLKRPKAKDTRGMPTITQADEAFTSFETQRALYNLAADSHYHIDALRWVNARELEQIVRFVTPRSR